MGSNPIPGSVTGSVTGSDSTGSRSKQLCQTRWMITSVHTLIYADDPDAARAFFRDILDLAVVDDGGGWLIFKLPPGELGVHPIDSSGPASGTTKLSLMCDDIERTVTELRAKGAVVSGEISDQGYGLVTSITVPGGVALDLYQPRHATAFDLEG
jgi:predicted enzyme related to lactoylglutathione lyase